MDLSRGITEGISITSILKPRANPRRFTESVDDLISSLQKEGLLQPIIVRPKNGRFELVAGSRRLEACRKLGWRKIQCHILDLTDREAFEVAIAENVARENLDPLEEANSFQEYVSKYGWGSEKDLARIIGKSPAYVSRRLRLLKLKPAELAKLFRRRKNVSLFEELMAVNDDSLRTELIDLSDKLQISSKELRRLRKGAVLKSSADYHIQHFDEETLEEREYRSIKLAIQKTVVALRLALYRLDEVIENVGADRWILAEVLMQQRLVLHSQIDAVMNLTKRMKKLSIVSIAESNSRPIRQTKRGRLLESSPLSVR